MNHSSNSGTSNLHDHLVSVHKIDMARVESFRLSLVSTQPTITFAARPQSDVSLKERHTALTKWLVAESLPLSVVFSPFLASFLSLLCPTYRLPHRTTLTRTYLPDLVEQVRVAIKQLISKASTPITWTADGWTDKFHSVDYITVSISFVADFQLQHASLATRHIPLSHSASNLADYIRSVFHEFDIPENIVMAGVVDNAKNMQNINDSLKGWTIPCFAHTLNLVIQDAIAKSPLAEAFFDSLADIVTTFKRSHTLAKALDQAVTTSVVSKSALSPSKKNSTRFGRIFFIV